jgi:uncharacterized integral membrane protein
MPEATASGHHVKLSARTIISVIVTVIALVFIFQNTHNSQVHILFWDISRPQWLILLILFAAGFVVGSLFPWFHRRAKANGPAQPSSQ